MIEFNEKGGNFTRPLRFRAVLRLGSDLERAYSASK